MVSKIKSGFKSEYGFTGQDLLIAMFILILFLGLMTGVYVNLSNTSYEIKLTADATEISTNVLEFVDECYFDEIVYDGTDDSGNDKCTAIYDFINRQNFDSKFTVSYSIVTNEDDENLNSNEKRVNVNVEYKWKDEDYKIERKFIKVKESIKPQNTPDLDGYRSLDSEIGSENYRYFVPVVYVCDEDDYSGKDGHFERVDDGDSDWYNYENHRWAIAVDGAEYEKVIDDNGDEVDSNVLIGYDRVYVWIPRFCVIEEDGVEKIFFLYKDTDKIIRRDEYGVCSLGDVDFDSLKLNYGLSGEENGIWESTGIWVEVECNDDGDLYLSNLVNTMVFNLFNRLSSSNYGCGNTRLPVD